MLPRLKRKEFPSFCFPKDGGRNEVKRILSPEFNPGFIVSFPTTHTEKKKAQKQLYTINKTTNNNMTFISLYRWYFCSAYE
jgi:hypothetical protein